MIVIIMGVSGAGKTTVGRLLAEDLGWRFYEGDDFHPQKNIEKMSRGTPLTDEDRAPWLARLAKLIAGFEKEKKSAILACSALKKEYRNRLKRADENVRFVHLKAGEALVEERLRSRKGHYMKADLLRSQFEALEQPEGAVRVDAALSPGDIVREIENALGLHEESGDRRDHPTNMD